MRPITPLLVAATAALLLAACVSPAAAAGPGGYHVVHRWKIGGSGGWDILTLDEGAHRLYFGRGDRMQVVDVDTGKLVGELPGTAGIHAVALAPDLGRGFTSNGRDSSVTIFDLKSLALIARVQTQGQNPDMILYEPRSKRVFSFNGRSHDVTALDAATGAVVGTRDLAGKPEFAACDGKGGIFVNLEDSSAVVQFDAASLAITARWSLAPGEEPTGIAYDAPHHRLFSACSNSKLIVSDSESGRVVGEVSIGTGVDGAALDSRTGLVFTPNGGDGTLTVIHQDGPDRYRVVETVPTQRGARTMVLDARTHHVYVAAAEYGVAPAATAENPRPRGPMIPDSFVILDLAR